MSSTERRRPVLGDELLIADTLCRRAEQRNQGWFHQLDDDEATHTIAGGLLDRGRCTHTIWRRRIAVCLRLAGPLC
jgi:hypothetical protein